MSNSKSKHPTHKGFSVEKYGDDQSFWTEVGAVFTHEDGQGFTLRIRKGIAVSGEIVIRTVKDEERYRARGGK